MLGFTLTIRYWGRKIMNQQVKNAMIADMIAPWNAKVSRNVKNADAFYAPPLIQYIEG